MEKFNYVKLHLSLHLHSLSLRYKLPFMPKYNTESDPKRIIEHAGWLGLYVLFVVVDASQLSVKTNITYHLDSILIKKNEKSKPKPRRDTLDEIICRNVSAQSSYRN